MPKVTTAHLQARRQQILQAASACFARKGFHQSTMQDICQLADLSPGAVYRYFASKEGIIEAMCDEGAERNRALIEAVAEDEETLQVLDRLAEAFFSGLEDAEACALDVEIWAEAVRNPRFRRILGRGKHSVREPFIDIVRRGQRRGDINPDLDPEAVARVMISFYLGLVLQRTVEQKVDVRSYVAAMKAMMSGDFWRGKRPRGGK